MAKEVKVAATAKTTRVPIAMGLMKGVRSHHDLQMIFMFLPKLGYRFGKN
jgi:hypothetical protein